jgi:hypothetical protein
MKKAEKEPSEIKTDPLTPEELREMYVMVKEIYHHLGLGVRQRSTAEIRRLVKHDIARWQERQAEKKERQGKKE